MWTDEIIDLETGDRHAFNLDDDDPLWGLEPWKMKEELLKRVRAERRDPEMRTFAVHTDHLGRYDMLNDIRLTAGERLRIRWPDGSEEEASVNIDISLLTSGGLPQSGGWDTFDSQAYIFSDVRGARTKIYVRNTMIFAKRMP